MKKNCWLGCRQDLDERQLLIRGNVFQHMTVLLFVLLLVNGFIKSEGITWAEGMWENILIIWAGLGLGLLEYIFRDILPVGGGMNAFLILEGILGLLLMVLLGSHLLFGNDTVVANGMLTSTGAELIQGGVMLCVGIAFLGRRLYERGRKEKEE